jgi:hypothetical protein
MGWWGNMGGPKQKGMIYYSKVIYKPFLTQLDISKGVSPFKQQAMKGAFSGYFFHGYKRIAGHFPYFIVPVALGMSFMSGMLFANAFTRLLDLYLVKRTLRLLELKGWTYCRTPLIS